MKTALAVLLSVLTGCVSLAHIAPAPRDEDQRMRAAVRVESHCADVRYEYNIGSGVVISERHVLTAHHVVRCATIPRVYIVTHDGQRHRAVVTREDPDKDIARLEIFHAGRLGLHIAPPQLAGTWVRPVATIDYLCAYVPNEAARCGPRVEATLFRVELKRGDSGTPVYDDKGDLVGIAIRDVKGVDGPRLYHVGARLTTVNATWLEGT